MCGRTAKQNKTRHDTSLSWTILIVKQLFSNVHKHANKLGLATNKISFVVDRTNVQDYAFVAIET